MTTFLKTTTTAAALAAAMLAIAAPASAQLACWNGNGDVVAYPIISNQGSTAIGAGTTILYTVSYPSGQSQKGSFVLSQPLNAGTSLSADNYYPWNFTCTASAQVRFQMRKLPDNTGLRRR